jgi:GT2 family glycosyltransferase
VSARVDLVVVDGAAPARWDRGQVRTPPASTPAALATAVAEHLADARPDALLFWDGRLGDPPATAVDLLDQPDDVWHGGLVLGTRAQPSSIDLVAPTWMLNADPPNDRPATSWRVALGACLVRTTVIECLGFLDPAFTSLTAAGLELGHRWISTGACCRHEPSLIPPSAEPPPLAPIGADDLARFVHRRYGSRWALYVTLRSRHRLAGLARLRTLTREAGVPEGTVDPPPAAEVSDAPTVSVVIPTIDRYPWLATALAGLSAQTTAPHEVLVVDQTPVERRQAVAAPPGLPLRLLVSEVAGQCTARNLAIEAATGELLLFIDDDDELPPDLLRRHLARLAQTKADANCGVAREPGEGDLDRSFRRFRQSDVFPTNNTLLRRAALADAGLFDLAYDRGERADHDLGMRLYLAGHRLVLDPDVEVLHHHAPRGGLRTHAARVSTYRRSRQTTTVRQTLAPTEVYLWRRYFRPDQVQEALALRLLGTFSRRGGPLQRALRVVVQLALLRDTRAQFAAAEAGASALEDLHPTIPDLDGARTP